MGFKGGEASCGARSEWNRCTTSYQDPSVQIIENYETFLLIKVQSIKVRNVYVKAKMNKNNKGKQNGKYMDYQD